ncbi:hypothetical protein [Bacillus thuringiensis]|uniref:hypothetical protein n=1 Tax=Bacillus thuringiensis TaxID=1428 RepID=UPI001586D52B|nr:hypothetical protein [Bacillus thuringiensis]
MKEMVIGRLFVWLGAGAFALGVRYGVGGNPISEFIQYVVAMFAMAYGMNLIIKGGEQQ